MLIMVVGVPTCTHTWGCKGEHLARVGTNWTPTRDRQSFLHKNIRTSILFLISAQYMTRQGWTKGTIYILFGGSQIIPASIALLLDKANCYTCFYSLVFRVCWYKLNKILYWRRLIYRKLILYLPFLAILTLWFLVTNVFILQSVSDSRTRS